MRMNLALGFVLLMGLSLSAVPTYAINSSRHLELVAVNEAVDEYGLMTFAGTVRNTHTTQWIQGVRAYVVLKREDQVIAIYEGWLDGRNLPPGETGSFFIEADYAEGEYDEFYVRLAGLLVPPDASFIVGEIIIIEESLNITQDSSGQTVVYGELINGTNAIIGTINLQFNLLDARGRLVGIALPHNLNYLDLWPNEKRDFAAIAVLTSDRRIEGWEVEIEIEAIRIVESDVPTVSTGTSWGQIKNHAASEIGR